MHCLPKTLVVEEAVLRANDAIAQANRAQFDRAGTYVINMVSSPGAGKTTLLERTLERLARTLRLEVLEGDVQTTLDADRLARFGVPWCRSSQTRASAGRAIWTPTWCVTGLRPSRSRRSTC